MQQLPSREPLKDRRALPPFAAAALRRARSSRLLGPAGFVMPGSRPGLHQLAAGSGVAGSSSSVGFLTRGAY